jgi:hypothetical protein
LLSQNKDARTKGDILPWCLKIVIGQLVPAYYGIAPCPMRCISINSQACAKGLASIDSLSRLSSSHRRIVASSAHFSALFMHANLEFSAQEVLSQSIRASQDTPALLFDHQDIGVVANLQISPLSVCARYE